LRDVEAGVTLRGEAPTGMLQDWIGRSREVEDEVAAPLMRRLAATLDLDPPDLRRGAPVPPHWIAVLFDDAQRQSALGADGHAATGEFLPPVSLPRRMLAGRRMRYERAPRIGDAVVRRSEIAAITPKEGRSGRLVFVTLRHTITGPEGVIAVEEQDLAYREAPKPDTAAAPAKAPALPDAAWQQEFLPDPVLLFRVSALQFNGHRIHYDADYARGAEGYPALVVNGTVTTLALIEAARRRAGRELRAYAARTAKPLFCGRRARLCGTGLDAAGGATLWAENEEGALAMRLDVEFAP